MASLPDFGGHSPAFRWRRFWNWFPMGLGYAFLYMGRYNLTVAKNSLGSLMDKATFGDIFAAGTWVYGLAFLLNGPLTDRIGGRRAFLTAVAGAAGANLGLGWYLHGALQGGADPRRIAWAVGLLYAINMYFQSFAAVAIVKVNAAWFHLRERGGFSGIFGTMIASGIFFAYTGNEWILARAEPTSAGVEPTWLVFYAPAALLAVVLVAELILLRDQPGHAGHADFETAEGRVLAEGEELGGLRLVLRILSHPVLLTVALIEFCTGVLRQAVMQWFPIYAREVWNLPRDHGLVKGSWAEAGGVTGIVGAVLGATLLFLAARRLAGRWRATLVSLATLLALVPFALGGGWGGLLFAAGVVGANLAGWCSDLLFGSRRGPTVACFYGIVTLGAVALLGVLDPVEQRPAAIGCLMFAMSAAVIGTHGLLSGTATMDFGGRKATGTAVGVIDGFVYLGTGLQAWSLGRITSSESLGWSWWPAFMLPFAAVGLILCFRIWHAVPDRAGGRGH
jgi:OPA family glycerol-3-phosphate transporter-like MFS transporter